MCTPLQHPIAYFEVLSGIDEKRLLLQDEAGQALAEAAQILHGQRRSTRWLGPLSMGLLMSPGVVGARSGDGAQLLPARRLRRPSPSAPPPAC